MVGRMSVGMGGDRCVSPPIHTVEGVGNTLKVTELVWDGPM